MVSRTTLRNKFGFKVGSTIMVFFHGVGTFQDMISVKTIMSSLIKPDLVVQFFFFFF